ncbi:Hypothetical protein FKW44_024360 [Caligus rogercresseyi]|uniref:Uncharacterized protein n=1 Tax=Caligus rogercresseyi TaxID=217165 RepID=A0A7T8GMA4_CALRO|nr:Hypothetical protein FKW44_024769 [Caligus rogercresseyi]QQP33108.1 Hypothetical protein FKW44_024360 [Caligus rogercresseyi]
MSPLAAANGYTRLSLLLLYLNQAHQDRDLISAFPDSCPGLSAIMRWKKDFDNGSFSLKKNTS